jgi:uncharacterized membrane protein YfcA
LIAYIALGIVFGIVGGMGFGGGLVLIPCLVLILGLPQHAAQGMTLFAYIPMAAAALITHIRRKTVRLKPVLFLAAFGALGGAGGYGLASIIDPATLRTAFAVFLIVVALLRVWRQEILPRRQKKS